MHLVSLRQQVDYVIVIGWRFVLSDVTYRKLTINARNFTFGLTRSNSIVYTSNNVHDFTSFRVIIVGRVWKLDANKISSYYIVNV